MSKSDTPAGADRDILIESSPLSRRVERDGVWVRICIFRGEGDSSWLLEIEDHEGGSTVWDDLFDTDQAALEVALRAIDDDGIESFAQASQGPDTKQAAWRNKMALPPLGPLRGKLDASPHMLSFHASCGVFAAVATAPELVPPSSWLGMIKGEHLFADVAEVQAFTGGVMSLYEEVLRSVADHDAHCCPEASDHDAVRAFCEGYLEVALRDATWEADQRAYVELLPIMALAGLTSMDKVGELIPSAATDPVRWLQTAREGLPETVSALYDYWVDGRKSAADLLAQRARPTRRESAKVGRNDPCPCGSGKKFKKCCAN